MGLFDKVKNIFTEEVEVEEPIEEVKVEQIKKEVTHVPIESPSVKRVEQVSEVSNENDEKSKGPVFFTDRDFEDLASPRHINYQDKKDEFFSKEELSKMYGTNAPKEKKEEVEEKIFKPTPIISPIYGILDKNYHKEDIVEKHDNNVKSVDGLSVDTIRNKAYGTLEEQLKDEMELVNINNNKPVNEKDLFEELEEEKATLVFDDEEKNKKNSTPEEVTMDLTQELDNLLQKKQMTINDLSSTTREEKNKNVAEKVNSTDLFNLIDSMYEGDDNNDN